MQHISWKKAGLVLLIWPFLHISAPSWKAVFIRCSSGSSSSEEHKNFDAYFPLPRANGIFSVFSASFLFFNFILDCVFQEKTSKSKRSATVKCPLPSWKKAVGSHLYLLAFIYLFLFFKFKGCFNPFGNYVNLWRCLKILSCWSEILCWITFSRTYPFSGHQTHFVSVTKHFLILHARILH